MRRFGVIACVCLLAVAACSSSNKKSKPSANHVDLGSASAASFTAHGSVGQVYVLGAGKQQTLDLVDGKSDKVATGTTDVGGSLIFRGIAVGTGYRVATSDHAHASAPVDVTAWDAPPPESFYDNQHIENGYGYITMRDGVQLSMTVKLPGPADKGPYPTVVEYSGYSPADPKSPQPSTLITQNLGYATVGVNMRGTGCSGGAFQFFEPLQSTDGYDIIETIAAQPWVKNHMVGMVGISYPGISQLFTAELNPPHLAAIAPLSVIDDTAKGTLAPGGILNSGFAVGWARDREHDSQAAPAGGQQWAIDRVKAGDKTCLANQVLHRQAPNILQTIDDNRYWTDAVAAPLSPELFVNKIKVPVYLAGAWQDEQTGGYFANLFDKFTGTKDAWFTAQNGSHTDSLQPTIFNRWLEFLSIFVAQEVPKRTGTQAVIANVIQQTVSGTNAPLPAPEFDGVKTLDEARKKFESFPRIRILFENGAGGAPGEPIPVFEADFDKWPIPGTTPTRWFLDKDGVLRPDAPSTAGTETYRYDPSRSELTTIVGGDDKVWAKLPAFNWPAPKRGTALAFDTAPLDHDVVAIGNASVDLWLQSTAPDTDLQVTITEIRPDGTEMYVQSGWLRASFRKLAPDATELRPTHPFTKDSVEKLVPGQWALARVEVFPFAHVFRTGSRIRIIIDAPGASRPRWAFDALKPVGNQINTIGLGAAQASSIVLPVVPSVKVKGGLPPCPSLRGEPCRPTAKIL